jgi:LmbE family N-acetylglucosaminyl deacetylase
MPAGDQREAAATTAPVALSPATRLLVVAPHPDDETLAAGVLIQQVLAAGGRVRILLLTPGDRNPWPQRWMERRLWIADADRQRWGVRRLDEFRQAIALLGLTADDVHMMGWPDQGLTARLQREPAASTQALRAVLDGFDPTVLVMPALDDPHPDHSAAQVLMRLALAARSPRPTCLAYQVHGGVAAAAARDIVEWTPTAGMLSRKRAAFECHRSQLALSGTRMRRFAARPERYVPIEDALPGAAPYRLPWQPAALYRPWLRLTAVTATASRVWAWRDAPLQRDGQGRWQLTPPADLGGGPCFLRLEAGLPSLWIFDRWGWCLLRD